MLKKDLLEKIKNAKDDEDINSLLSGTDIETQFKGEEPNLDVFKQKIKADKVFQQFMDTERDTYHAKAVKTMKEKGTWETEFYDVLKQKYPDLIKDPKDKAMADLQAELAKMKAEAARKDLLSEAMKYANEKKINTKFVEKFLGEDLEKTKVALDDFVKDYSKDIEAAVTEKMKSNSYTPGAGSDGKPQSIGASLATQANKSKAPSNNDPWASK